MLDELEIIAIAGNGGDGAISFRRERYIPRGGPDGGDGGKGGSVILRADPAAYVLDGLRRTRTLRADGGGKGAAAKRHGKNGRDLTVDVPVGTIVWSIDGEERKVADLAEPRATLVIAKGGRGGRGNGRMARSTRQTPRIAEKGLPGEHVKLRFEVRLIAQAGLVGLPNAGKSSLLQAVSAARPKVGAYKFTTLEPYLGVVEVDYERLVMADIPGLVEGAHEGTGLGSRFLRHIQRTAVLVLIADASGDDPLADIEAVRGELEAFGHGVVGKRWLVALNKIDLSEARSRAQTANMELKKRGIQAFAISALTGEGTQELVRAAFAAAREEEAAALPTAADAPNIRPAAGAFEVRKRNGAFDVLGARPAEVIAQIGLESDEARLEVASRLRRMGVLGALRRAGVAPGDRVCIGHTELEWPL